MSKIRTIRHKACMVATAAALALAMMPNAALAQSQTNGTANVLSNTVSNVNEGSAAGGVATAYASARSVQMSVTAPMRIDFVGSGSDAYDVNNKANWGTLSASVQFTNLWSKPVYLSDVAVQQTSDANVGKIFSGTPGSTANPLLTLQNASSNGTETATLATLASTTATSHMQFGSSAAAADQQNVAKKFKIAKNSSGSGTASTFTLKLDPTAATLRSNADLAAAGALQNATTDFAKIVWTFAVQPIYESGQGTASTAADGFYLKINDAPVSSGLEGYAGEVYSLSQVQRHSKLLGSGTEGVDSELYDFYYALTTSMYPESDYSCYVKYASADWRLRIIGLNQDYASTTAGSGDHAYKAGDRVGLTFQFLNLIGTTAMGATSNTTGGWGGNSGATARAALSTNGTFYKNLNIASSIVPVTKYYSSVANTTAGNVTSISSQMFVLSMHELCGSITKIATGTGNLDVTGYTWLPKEGVGKTSASANGQQYLFYQGKTTGGNSCSTADILKWLIKVPTNSATTCYVTTEYCNTATYSYNVWTRSMYPGSSSDMVQLTKGGLLYGTGIHPSNVFYIAPAFCL